MNRQTWIQIPIQTQIHSVLLLYGSTILLLLLVAIASWGWNWWNFLPTNLWYKILFASPFPRPQSSTVFLTSALLSLSLLYSNPSTPTSLSRLANNFSFHYNFWWITFLQAELTPSLLHPLHSMIPSALSHPILTMAKAPLKSYRHHVLLSSCLNCYINAVYPPPHASLSLTHSITNERLSALSVSRLRPPPPAVPSYIVSPESH